MQTRNTVQRQIVLQTVLHMHDHPTADNVYACLLYTSSGTNVAAAIQLAKKLGPGKTVVTVLPDTAERYFSTPLFED